jgi:flagellar biosynthesis/type III secretory pathway M-ring protein FliF/YscJ
MMTRKTLIVLVVAVVAVVAVVVVVDVVVAGVVDSQPRVLAYRTTAGRVLHRQKAQSTTP